MSQLEFQVAVFSPKLVSELGFVFCAQVFLSPDCLSVKRMLSSSERHWNPRGLSRLVSDTALVNAERRSLQQGVAGGISQSVRHWDSVLNRRQWDKQYFVLNTLEDKQKSIRSIVVFFSPL